MVPRLRRLFDPGPNEESLTRNRDPTRTDRLYLRDRLQQPLPVLCQYLRSPLDPWPRTCGCNGTEVGSTRTERLGHHWRRGRFEHRWQSFHPPASSQRRLEHRSFQQPNLRIDQRPILTDERRGSNHQEYTDGCRRPSPESDQHCHRSRSDLHRTIGR